jgi:HEAT repeat protein
MFPDEVAEACLYYIASRELNAAGRSMAFWLSSQGRYVNILFESDAVPADVARKALAALKTVDEAFLVRFLKAAEQITSSRAILRALSLVPALGDYSILIPWLRRLSVHSNARVASRAVKLLCGLRPNKALIERQMLSKDPRVRANAIEGLWHSRTPEAKDLLKLAAADPSHRVVGGALVGLHLQGDESAFARMGELSTHPDPLMRAAMAWGFGFIGDERAMPFLYGLSRDAVAAVRRRALRSLMALQPNEAAAPSAAEILEASSEPAPGKPELESAADRLMALPLPGSAKVC